MMDNNKLRVVEYLDEPERILFFTVDEFVCLMFPIALGIQTKHLLLGLLCGILMMLLARKLKSQDEDRFLQRQLYWYFPAILNRLKVVPASHLRRFQG